MKWKIMNEYNKKCVWMYKLIIFKKKKKLQCHNYIINPISRIERSFLYGGELVWRVNNSNRSTYKLEVGTTCKCPRITFESFNWVSYMYVYIYMYFWKHNNVWLACDVSPIITTSHYIPHHSDNFTLLGIQHHVHTVN